MEAHITWNGHVIGGTDGREIRLYKDLALSFSTKTKAKDGNDVLYIEKQGYNAAQFQATLELRAQFGQDVMGEIRAWRDENRAGTCAKIMFCGQDLFGSNFMLTGVDVSGMQTIGNALAAATVKLTFSESEGESAAVSSPVSSSTDAAETSKGDGSKYLKDQKDKGGDKDSTNTEGKGNLTGMAGGYNPSGIIKNAKKTQTSLTTK